MSNTKYGLALLGCGTVGSGVYDLLTRQGADIEAKYGFQFDVRKILVRDSKKLRSIKPQLLTTDFNEIINDSKIDVVVEVMGGEMPAKEYVTAALRSGRHVITANKALMGAFGERLVEKARSHNLFFGFSAAVTGFHQFVPSIVKSMMITELTGIFNGTTNYILCKLAHKSFDEALRDAQALGYAEADHTNDTEGHDTRNKLVVASKLAFGVFLPSKDIPVIGIKDITQEDIAHAADLGYVIKLLGVSRVVEDRLTSYVAPSLLPQNDPLATVHDVNNGILIRDQLANGVQGMIAAGAGKGATAKAIFSDLLGLARGEKTLWPEASSYGRNLKFTAKNNLAALFYVRVNVDNQPGVLATVSKRFAREGLNIIEVSQKAHVGSSTASIVFLMGPARQKVIEKILDGLVEAKIAVSKPLMLRVEHSPEMETESTPISTKTNRDKLVPA